MSVIYVGRPAINRSSSTTAGFTMVNQGLVADGSGIINAVGFYNFSILTDPVVIIFQQIDATHLTARSFVEIADVAAGSEQIITLDRLGGAISLPIEIGDIIGFYCTTGLCRRATSGFDNLLYTQYDQRACVNKAFSNYAEDCMSMYGTGITVAVGIKWNGVTISKFNNQVISKWN